MISDLNYYTLRDHIAGDLMRGILDQKMESVMNSVRSGALLSASDAADFTVRFFSDLKRHVSR